MPLMTYKSGFEPKDARTINTYEEDDDLDDFDDWSLETTPSRPRRRKTGTQALVEFLNTTSPEEFQKTPTTTHSTPVTSTKRTSTSFFLRRRNKNKSSSNSASSASPSSTTANSSTTSSSIYPQGAPNTIHRKNYIEIIAQYPRIPYYHDSHTPGCPPIQAVASASKLSLNEPVLPSRRDSSLYSASIRSLSIKAPTSPYPKINTSTTIANNNNINNNSSNDTNSNTNNNNNNNNNTTTNVGNNNTKSKTNILSRGVGSIKLLTPSVTSSASPTSPPTPSSSSLSHGMNPSLETDLPSMPTKKDTINLNDADKKQKVVDALISSCDEMDVIEAGLIERLKRCQLYGIDKPMDMVTSLLTEEHIRALKVSSTPPAVALEVQVQQEKRSKKQIRHVQVQTLPWNEVPSPNSPSLPPQLPTPIPADSTLRNSTLSSSSLGSLSSSLSPEMWTPMVQELQLQLEQEKQERQRLEAALEATCDHFEVLSGLAYKKLRELWEEKLKWENACIELNDRLLATGQHPSQQQDSSTINDIMTEDYQHSDYLVG